MYLFNAILIHVQRNFMLRPVVRNQGQIARPPAQRRYLYAQKQDTNFYYPVKTHKHVRFIR